MTTTSRRAILAGAAALATVPAVAVSPTLDPIFAAIERHRDTFIQHAKASSAQAEEPDFGPEHRPDQHAAIQAAASEARSLRSPRNTSVPRPLKRSTFSGFEWSLASVLRALPCSARRRQISPPSIPVAPTIKFMADLAFI